MGHHYRSYGVHRGVLDSAVSDFREGGHGSVSGECPKCQTRARAQERRHRLPVAAIPALGGAAARLVPAGTADLRHPFVAPSPRQSSANGRCARATHAESTDPDESTVASRSQ